MSSIKEKRVAFVRACVLAVTTLAPVSAWSAPFDLVIRGGRVLDPETGLDQVMNVAVAGGHIARITAEPLTGTRTIDARGLVVAPGFIDLHQHGQDEASAVLKAFDGVTSALEMEIGSPDVKAFLTRKTGHSIINFGTSASHSAARAAALGQPLGPTDLIFGEWACNERPRNTGATSADGVLARGAARRGRRGYRDGNPICAGGDAGRSHSYLSRGREPPRARVHACAQRRQARAWIEYRVG
jgi:hypothetical protein